MFYRILDKLYVLQLSSKTHNIATWFSCSHVRELQNNNNNHSHNNIFMEAMWFFQCEIGYMSSDLPIYWITMQYLSFHLEIFNEIGIYSWYNSKYLTLILIVSES